jgi:DNA-binding protein HU-beta
MGRIFRYICRIKRFINHIKSFIMNKAELIDAMAAGANLSKADAKKALDAFVDASTAALKKGDRISLVGFGSFSVSSRKARNGRNPKTGAVIKIAAKKSVRFKAGAELSGKVN